mmetsp:Transcript_12754/g.36014  ORF Transcript_12754/g.36014 Transcript_12754/m.36014 type:complete len:278 (-) Transcript_12754:1693-2526(-)
MPNSSSSSSSTSSRISPRTRSQSESSSSSSYTKFVVLVIRWVLVMVTGGSLSNREDCFLGCCCCFFSFTLAASTRASFISCSAAWSLLVNSSSASLRFGSSTLSGIPSSCSLRLPIWDEASVVLLAESLSLVGSVEVAFAPTEIVLLVSCTSNREEGTGTGGAWALALVGVSISAAGIAESSAVVAFAKADCSSSSSPSSSPFPPFFLERTVLLSLSASSPLPPNKAAAPTIPTPAAPRTTGDKPKGMDEASEEEEPPALAAAAASAFSLRACFLAS